MKRIFVLTIIFSLSASLFSQNIENDNKEVCPSCELNKCIFKDNSERKYCEVECEKANCFSEGFASVKINNKWGYINIKGEVVIKPEFDGANDFSQGFASINIGGTTDKTGSLVGGQWGYINKMGNVIIKPQFDEAEKYNEGFALIRKEKKYGYINSTGQLIINPQYDSADAFHENYAQVCVKGKCGFIDKTGNIKIKLSYDLVYNFSEGLAGVTSTYENKFKWGFINKQGLQVIKQKYDGVQSFHEGLAGVKIIDKWGFIDKTGQLVIEPLFDDSSLYQVDDNMIFNDGKVSGELNGENVTINNKGEIVGVGSDTNDPFVNSILIASTYLNQAQSFVIANKSIKAGKNRNLALKILSKEATFGKIIDSEKIGLFTHEVDSVWGWHFFTLSLDEKRKVLFWFSTEKGMLINNPQYFTSKKVFEQIENMKDGEEVHAKIRIVKNKYGKPVEVNDIHNNAVIPCQILSIKKD